MVGGPSRRGAEALERAFASYEDAGRAEDAGRVAATLAYQAFRRLSGAVGGGWVAQAQRMLDGLPDAPLRAQLGVYQTLQALMEGRIESGIELADRTMALARRLDNQDALYMAMSFKGLAEIMSRTLAERHRPDRRGCRGRVHGPARPSRRERHLLQHDRGVPERRRPRARRAVDR